MNHETRDQLANLLKEQMYHLMMGFCEKYNCDIKAEVKFMIEDLDEEIHN